jgi:hypothetical protein
MDTKGNELMSSFRTAFGEDINGITTYIKSDNIRAAIARQSERFEKKYHNHGNSDLLHNKALDDFLVVNELAKHGSVKLNSEDAANARLFIAVALERFTSDYTDVPQCSLDLKLLMQLWRFGPGASRHTKSTHFADKINDRSWSVTEECVRLGELLVYSNPHLRSLNAGEHGKLMRVTEGSSLTSVPKNETTNRTICTEPLVNMAVQLGAGAYVEGALRRIGIDISVQQDKNKFLAWAGSKYGEFATLDLKSASDLIRPALIQDLWPADWYHLMMMSRSAVTKVRNDLVELNMMSTMGNGFTFPVMTLTLSALVYACLCRHHLVSSYWLDENICAVFGDDIIVPTECYASMIEILGDAGLVVNNDKSYASGPFRESCGGDYWDGYDITPFYVKSLETEPEIYIAINQLMKWCSKHGLLMESSLKYLLSLIGNGRKALVVPEWECPDSGVLLLGCPRRYNYLRVKRKQVVREVRPPDIMSVLGGYVSSAGKGKIMYSRRSLSGNVYDLVKTRMPKGYREGYDPLYGPYNEATWRDLFYRTVA